MWVAPQALDAVILNAAAREVEAGEGGDVSQQLHARVRDVLTVAEAETRQGPASVEWRDIACAALMPTHFCDILRRVTSLILLRFVRLSSLR